MERWLEEFEMKHIDFMRAMASFHKMHEVWATLSTKVTTAGSAAFARCQSWLYYELHTHTRAWFLQAAERRFLGITEENIVETIQKFRKEELGWLMKYGRSPAT